MSSKLTITIVTILLLQIYFAKGDSGEHNSSGLPEECQDYDLHWFIQQYDRRILTKPFLNIGVNISLPDAAVAKHWKFRQQLKNAHIQKLMPQHVCEEGLPEHPQQLNQACSWNYTCDYNPHRFPAYVFHAHCKSNHWWHFTPPNQKRPQPCRLIYYPVPMLYNTGCNPVTSKKNWEWRQEMVSVACA